MVTRLIRISFAAFLASLVALALVDVSYPATAEQVTADNGVVRAKSSYGFDETVARLKADIAAKGITFFMAVDQAKLASDSKIMLRPSTLLIFGNPALGTQFLTSNPAAGLDWPVRLLVHQDAKGDVWTVYSDFGWIARRHGIKDRDAAFAMASKVIASITSSVVTK
jgi:uncharacterized protein (DUF302 family)